MRARRFKRSQHFSPRNLFLTGLTKPPKRVEQSWIEWNRMEEGWRDVNKAK